MSLDISKFFDQPSQNYALRKQLVQWGTEEKEVAQRKQVPTETLLKVVHNGRVVWVTAEEVEALLKESEDESKQDTSFKANIEKALRGTSRTLVEEIRVLLYLAIQTLSQRVEDRTVTDNEAEQLTKSLRRRFEEAENNIEGLYDVETELTERKRADPVFVNYERKMAEMLQLQKSGQMADATTLAKQLMREKKQYLLRSRALEPLNYTACFYRLDLQKGKGRVLGMQQRLCEMRDTVVREALQRLRKSLGAGSDDLAVSADSKQGQDIRNYIRELRQLELEVKMLVKTIGEVDRICNWIEDEVFKDEKLKKAAITHAQTRKTARSGVDTKEPHEKPGKPDRMATMLRRKEKGKTD